MYIACFVVNILLIFEAIATTKTAVLRLLGSISFCPRVITRELLIKFSFNLILGSLNKIYQRIIYLKSEESCCLRLYFYTEL
jgi:hypothetical protein